MRSSVTSLTQRRMGDGPPATRAPLCPGEGPEDMTATP
jgi:hypothetical protein